MKKIKKWILKFKTPKIIGIIILCIAIISFVIYIFTPNINKLPEGSKISSHDSPDGKHTINMYLIMGEHATVADSIRGELVNNTNNKKKNIYWRYAENYADVEWVNNDTVIINGKKLNIHKDVYNWKKDDNWEKERMEGLENLE